jgi:hypothetical protein
LFDELEELLDELDELDDALNDVEDAELCGFGQRIEWGGGT